MNKVNKEALDLIKSFEGLELKAYKCPADVWTIGYGHTSAAGNPKVVAGLTITAKEAEEILLRDIVKYENAVKKHVKVPLNDNQYGALVSFTYNLGEGSLASSTLLKKLNTGDYKSVPSELNKWVKSGGKTLPGLVRRREAEGKLFNTPVKAVISPSHVVVATPDTKPREVPETPKYSFVASILKFLFGGK